MGIWLDFWGKWRRLSTLGESLYLSSLRSTWTDECVRPHTRDRSAFVAAGLGLEGGGLADQVGAVHVAVLLGEETFAGAFEDGDEILQIDFGWIIRWDEVVDGGFQILGVDGGFILQAAAHVGADQDGFDVGTGERAGAIEEKLFDVGGKRFESDFALHSAKQGEALFGRVGIEEGDVLFGASLALEIDGKKIGAAGEKKPDYFSAIFRVAHELRDLSEDAVADAAVAGAGAVAQLGVGFVDDDDNGAHRFQQVEHALEIAFGNSLPHAAKIFEGDGGDADFPGEAGSDESFSGADGAADDVAHGKNVGVTGVDGGGGVLQFAFGLIVAGDVGEIEAGLHEFEQAAGFGFDQVFLF